MRTPLTKTAHKNARRYLIGVGALTGALLLGACTDQQQASTAKTTPQATAPPAAKAASPPAAASPAAATSPPARAASPAAAPSPAVRAASPSPSPAARVASPPPAPRVASPSPAAGAVTTDSGAATLRTRLNTLLQEHVYLAADVTDAALNNRSAELEAAQEAINQNTRELGNIIESAYGVGVEGTFEDVWTRHTGYLVDYARAVAANDPAQKQEALDRLTEFRRDLDALLTAPNPNLPPGSVANLLEGHVVTQLAVIDAQAADDPRQVYLRLEEAAEHVDRIAKTLASAIVRQFPDLFR